MQTAMLRLHYPLREMFMPFVFAFAAGFLSMVYYGYKSKQGR
jgi:hypothetical protein